MKNFVEMNDYIMPNSPPFGPEKEKEFVEKMKSVRQQMDKEISGECPECGTESSNSIMNFTKNQQCNKCNSVVKYKLDHKYYKQIAEYESTRHQFALKYAFIVKKIARAKSAQCQRGMDYDDLCQVGFSAVLNVTDKWPPFNGGEDRGSRILSSIQTAVNNAICRFLDDHNREIKVPSYKIEQITVRIKADNVLYGKLEKKTAKSCQKCTKCKNMHSNGCRRKKPGKFENAVKDFIIKINNLEDGTDEEIVEAVMDADNKSLKDLARENNKYKDLAKVVDLDINSLISIIEPTVSIDTPDENQNGTIGDLIEHEECGNADQDKIREIIEEALSHINDRNASMLKDHFFSGYSMRELAQKYKKFNKETNQFEPISVVRASALIKKSIEQIKRNNISMNILLHKVVSK